MKFAILGAGALGTILGAHLSRAGHEVAMIVRGERARTLQRQGLVLNGLSDIKARPTVIDDPANLRETGTLIIATKAIDTSAALETLRHVRIDNAFSVQNGVLKNELLARVFGFSRVRMFDAATQRTPAASMVTARSSARALVPPFSSPRCRQTLRVNLTSPLASSSPLKSAIAPSTLE